MLCFVIVSEALGRNQEVVNKSSLLTQGQHHIISVQKQNLYPAGLFVT